MKIKLNGISKFYVSNKVLDSITYTFENSGRYAILGPNGSGKSTLVGVITGLVEPTEGFVQYEENNALIKKELFYQNYSFAAPYISFVDDFSLIELIDFHFKIKESYLDVDSASFAEFCLFTKKQHKILYKHFSSGMKQRLKIGLAILTKSKVLLLDEPLSNLDEVGKKWYHSLLESYLNDRTLIIASNDNEEYAICTNRLTIGG